MMSSMSFVGDDPWVGGLMATKRGNTGTHPPEVLGGNGEIFVTGFFRDFFLMGMGILCENSSRIDA